jgi:hypothetical protein
LRAKRVTRELASWGWSDLAIETALDLARSQGSVETDGYHLMYVRRRLLPPKFILSRKP